jgi:NAD(P)-dependent dehydrogenase (short-subunit alcohol dehydrogenase family)
MAHSATVLVTGASSGIGAATVTLLAARGFRVWGASRRPRETDGAIRWLAMDVRNEAAVRAGVERIIAADGAIDALVCNAGIGIFGSVEETHLERARAQFETNVFGTLIPVRAVLPSMRARGQGRIVIVGSLAGRAPIPFQTHYSATKSAVDALAVGLRMELATTGVGVALIEPGDIKTAFNDVTDWGDPVSSAYGERLRRCETVIRAELEKAPGPEIVARTILTALTARRPRMRYPVGPSSRLVPIARRLLPDGVALRLIRSHFKV